MATAFQKQVKAILAAADSVFPDKIICRRSGAVEVKRAYFYRHGRTAEKWSRRVKAALAENGLAGFDLDYRDDWAAWPRTSYFVAVLKPR